MSGDSKGNKSGIKRIERLIRLLGLLQGGRPRNVESLATECKVHRRTVFRDLDLFRRCGLHLLYDEERQGYILPHTYFLPPTNFSPDEALALIVLCHELGARRQLPFYEAIRSAVVKLENNLPSRLRDEVSRVANAVHIKLESINPLDSHRSSYDALVDAISRRRCVRIEYAPPANAESFQTKLSPYQLLFSRRSWYVIGRSSLHRARRTFNLGRIRNLEPLDEKFQMPRHFSIERHLRNAWHMIPEKGRDQQVVVRFDPLVANNVAEVMWHRTQKTTFQEDGSLLFEATVSGLWEISWWIMGYGDQAEVVRPKELREMVADRANKLAARYNADSNGSPPRKRPRKKK
ncbi:MAG: WYL domain-containing protein [Planctomycetales bacterium]|nr:WYL domain-containing protein [Planctomycetales bacterium]